MRSRSYLYPFIILLLVVLYYYYLKVAQIVLLSCFRPLSNSILVKNGTFTRFQLVCDRPTDGPTDGRTDGQMDGRTDAPSYRDVRTHLKKSVTETNAPREGKFSALCSGGKNLITYRASFLPILL